MFPYKSLKEITVPTRIIHGNKDTYVSYEDSVSYLSQLKGSKELVTIKGAEHGFQDDPHTWRQAVDHTLVFFEKYL